MIRKLVFILIAAAPLAGCGGMDRHRLDQLDQAVVRYAQALRWQRYEDLRDGILFTGARLMRETADWNATASADNLGWRDQRFFADWATAWRRNFTDGELKVRLETGSHAPASVRAHGTPSNVPAHAAAFGCKAGDAMVRAKRVAIW